MKKKFETITISSTVVLEKQGLEILSFIAGVNSGVYGLPFVIRVRCWARKWWFKRFFCEQMDLDLAQCERLRNELNKVIAFEKTRLENIKTTN